MTTFTGSIATVASGDTTTVPTSLATYRDALKAVTEAWTAYTPAWTGVSGNPAIGNGTIAAAYSQAGKLIHFRVVITMGSTTTYGSGQWRVSLPVSPVSSARQLFIMDLNDSGGAGGYSGVAIWESASSALGLACPDTTAGNPYRAVTGTVPFTWGAGDTVVITGAYEGA